LRDVVTPLGGKGGGRADMAQGGAPIANGAEIVNEAIEKALIAAPKK
jgi:alanyl-tRNA synthetase